MKYSELGSHLREPVVYIIRTGDHCNLILRWSKYDWTEWIWKFVDDTFGSNQSRQLCSQYLARYVADHLISTNAITMSLAIITAGNLCFDCCYRLYLEVPAPRNNLNSLRDSAISEAILGNTDDENPSCSKGFERLNFQALIS